MRDRAAVPVLGEALAQQFHVSRQCIVQDIAILRAGGADILATPRGYCVPRDAPRTHREVLACCHPPEKAEEELRTLVDFGVKILDVVVDHPVYGELRGALMIESRADVQDFMERVSRTKATLLSELTGGTHLHTVEASRPEMIARAKEALRGLGFLLK
jgi:hypothetical protein